MAHFCAITTTAEELELFYWVNEMNHRKLVFGVGVNDSGQAVVKREEIGYVNGKRKRKIVWECAYYTRWRDMLRRCYDAKYQEKKPTYVGCTVSNDWLTFTNFKNWMAAQDWEGKHLDKDLLVEGNKVYGPDTCVFVTPTVNSFTNDRGNDRGEWLIGVCWDKRAGKFLAQCSNPFTKKNEKLGHFDCEQEAHQAWKARKLELAHELAATQEDPRVAKALVERYSEPFQLGA